MAFSQAAVLETAVLPEENSSEALLRLGLMCSTGAELPADKIAAHKWFNLAAMRGNREAARLRQELAGEMSANEIASAQRAAREWLTR